MESSQFYSILIFIICIILSAFFSSSETAFTSAKAVRLKNKSEDGDKRAEKTLKLQQQFESLLSTILIGNNLVNIAGSAVATIFFVAIFPTYGGAIATIVTTLLLLFFGEIAPKLLAKLAPEKVAMFSQPVLSTLMLVLKPFIWLLNKWQNLVKRFIPVDSAYTISEAELLSFVEEARVEGSIEHDEHLLVKAAIEFDDVNVSSILTPRIDVVGAEIDDPDEKIEDIFEHSPFSRLVIYEETVDNVIGVLHEKDFHRYLKAKSQQKVHATSIVSLLSEVLFVPPVMKLSDLLRLMQRNKNHMAIIIDEHGGMTGIATMEDVLEELVGEIWDERDVIEEEFHVIEPDRKFLVKGTYSIVKLFERFDIDPDEEWLSHTVSGFVIESLERMPQQGDSYTCNHYRFEVVDVKNRRVDEIMITYEPDATDDDQVTE
ncbi:HlyC/CorC family transporter [Dolosigranulum pigrum]|uniref:Uncharacterized protein n=1 Tax=Dolosigranulum pigrum TaxID=29394 RepID=A0A1S8KMW6_9LACT|nr:hemolysin family protein [Dolosigranulum pigrum]OOL81022.1 hypothetical protein BWX42_03995 [Dolosigranulum pigrum]QJS98432.1 HlyC/CorC family transporter [Dolosigranulum pigrum]QTJ33029.1 HlyC/CorC family transporter [Dolosigranulum pigrum]QTJ41674.1 HlyC/CorC family transporter [Dolosigranulum pigrum]QTJ46787.1 HlyC/CorC family transporter [Dolosigranulum pigrum]